MSLNEHYAAQFQRVAREQPDRIFARFHGHPVTFSCLDRMSDALAAELTLRGIRRGDRVAVMLNNGIPALAAIVALMKAGFISVPVNVRLRGEGLRYVIDHSEARALLLESEFQDVVKQSGFSFERVVCLFSGENVEEKDNIENILQKKSSFSLVQSESSGTIAILYTSGTTGRAKGVRFSNSMLLTAGKAAYLASTPKPGDIFFVWEPLYHVAGLQNIVLPLLEEVELAIVERFSASRFWKQVTEAGATHIHPIGGVMQILLKQAPGPFDRAHRVAVSWGGAGACDNLDTFRSRFGIEVRPTYGMTEASSITTTNTKQVAGSIGQAVPWFSVTIRDEDGLQLPNGEVGEIVITTTSPGAIFDGYFKDGEASTRILKPDGLHSGDKGWMDGEGNVYFAGRLTDSFRCKGENVSAWEVEHIAAGHPAVAACALTGLTAEIGEQELMLFVQRKPGYSLSAPALSAWLSDRLASYQNPRYIKFVKDFDRTPSLRIVKRALDMDVRGSWDRSEITKSPCRNG